MSLPSEAEQLHLEAQTGRDAEGRYRMLFDFAPDGMVIADQESRYLDANASICRMLGYSHDEFVGLHISDIVAPSEFSHIGVALRTLDSAGTYRREWRFKRRDGSTFSAEVLASRLPNGNLFAIIRDSTERSRHEARLRRLVDSNVQGVSFWNARADVTNANDAYLELIGYTRAELDAGVINTDVMTPREFAAADRRALAEIAATGVCVPYEKEYVRRDGSHVPVLVGAAAFEDESGEGISFVVDLTDRKRLEQQLFRAQRMESIGTLAGGIAHDLNNVLTPILLSVEVLRDLVSDGEAAAILATLKTSAEHGSMLVRQVLSFARGVEVQRSAVNLAHVVKDLLEIIRDTFPKSIDVRFSSASDLWMVSGSRSQLHQIVLNLCVNARDAMPSGGTLSIELQNTVLDETHVAMHLDARAGRYVVVTVTDTGVGMPHATQERAFEPFFTTKEIGQGTGLGLSTTLAVVKGHGGFIHLYSEADKGTTFKVFLPASVGDVEPILRAREEGDKPVGHGELVLVIDDEEAIRKVARATLERYGYRVLVAANGAEGVALYDQYRTEIDVVLTDMAMPVMDGPAAIMALKAINPRVRIICSSGLASDTALAKARAAGVHHFVPKPYTAEVILNVVASVLRGA